MCVGSVRPPPLGFNLLGGGVREALDPRTYDQGGTLRKGIRLRTTGFSKKTCCRQPVACSLSLLYSFTWNGHLESEE